MITSILVFVSILVIAELICYVYLLFTIPPKPWHLGLFSMYLGRGAYGIAYLQSLLRAPLGLIPYLVKAFIFFGLHVSYESPQTTYTRELLNMAGDALNLAGTTLLVSILVGFLPIQSPAWLLYLPLGAELVRILTERIPITFSAAWQLIPHRTFASKLQAYQHKHTFWRTITRFFASYCHYYTLAEADRAQYVLDVFKQYARRDADLSRRLEYIQAFRIVPQHHGLRSGHVRDVARGEVFIHAIWTNDPWVLVGITLRRTAWMFDPRYLRRPFYYMTEANPLATLFVLEHGKYSLPYAIFQFGHEIRVARLHLFYYVLRKLGIDIEARVLADGTFEFDQFIFHLARKFGFQHTPPRQRLLYNDEEVIADFMQLHVTGERLTARDIAIQYTYPLQYLEEVLLPQIDAAIS